ncbi:MAG TPA: rhodanese-related sulfurtransferase [Phaeodactylibacter sp.]|nr:rhodanese-related sulfurtransferase [Phaeodactylibacter sp.]
MKVLHNKINKEELKQQMLESNVPRTTLSFYKYALIENPKQFRNELYQTLQEVGVFGRIYVSGEGVNGQISVPTENLEAFKNRLFAFDFLENIRLNIAIDDDGKSFYVLKIKLREKIVADGLNDESFDVTKRGTHLSAEKFNELTDDPNTIIVDMRNHYEMEVGHFENAILPDVDTFREALPIVEKMLEKDKDKNIIMYCTGGIRCEKASAYYKHKGFQKVYQLDGGIIEYARQAKKLGIKNKFIGKNFVFDDRMGERISEDIIAQCHQCGNPADTHVNCKNDACHVLFIQCDACAAAMDNCCSDKCKDFIQLPLEEQEEKKKTESFNGTKFGKGRYKAHRKKGKL